MSIRLTCIQYNYLKAPMNLLQLFKIRRMKLWCPIPISAPGRLDGAGSTPVYGRRRNERGFEVLPKHFRIL